MSLNNRAQDGLFMMPPYKPGKIPVVLVHGTASRPARWAEMVNELEGDPVIRERFQIWVFIYDSGNMIPYSAGRLRGALTDTVQELDPEGKDPALQRMVVIGHSQGGLLTKLTAIDSGTRFWDHISSKPFDKIKVSPETNALLKQPFFLRPCLSSNGWCLFRRRRARRHAGGPPDSNLACCAFFELSSNGAQRNRPGRHVDR